MPGEIIREIITRLPGIRLFNFYGQTELSPVATVLKPEDQLRQLGSAGRPALNVETCVVDVDERPRSEERRVGKECVSTCKYLWTPYHQTKELHRNHLCQSVKSINQHCHHNQVPTS